MHAAPKSCACMVQAESPEAIREAVFSELRRAKLICSEMSYLRKTREISVVPPDFMHFTPPEKR
jgi:hypothetical protein